MRKVLLVLIGILFMLTNVSFAETLTVSSDTSVSTSSPLVQGVEYEIIAEGLWQFAASPILLCDAEWANDSVEWVEIWPSPDPDRLDLLINENYYDWMGTTDGVNFSPHTFSPSHIYKLYITGTGAPIELRVRDTYTGDNSGSLTVTIDVAPDLYEICNDTIDNDEDGYVDCNDPDCVAELDCLSSCDSEGNEWIFINSGILNGQAIDSSNHKITVNADDSITGNINITALNQHGSGAVVPVCAGTDWDDRTSNFWMVAGHTPVGNRNHSVSVNVTAPSTPGTYYIFLTMGGEFNCSQVMSSTSWAYGTIVWNDGNDVVDFSDAIIDTAIQYGCTRNIHMRGNGEYYLSAMGMNAVIVNVSEGGEQDTDGDGYSPPEDCDDGDEFINPDTNEVCDDTIDNDCDGMIDCDDSGCDSICDSDGDGISNDEDNCVNVPNGDILGTCKLGLESRLWTSCQSNIDCGDFGVCSKEQEDTDHDSVGDVCDPCPYSTNNHDSDFNNIGDACEQSELSLCKYYEKSKFNEDSTYYARFPKMEVRCDVFGLNCDLYIIDYITVEEEVGGDTCMGRCGKDCPGYDLFFECWNSGRYTQDCLNHDACVKAYSLVDPACQAIFDNATDDCFRASDCEPDSDSDGTSDEFDECPSENAAGRDVDANGCIDNIEDLPQVVEDLNLDDKTEKKFLEKVDKALKQLDKGKIGKANSTLKKFIKEVKKALMGNNISEEDADMLIKYAKNVINLLWN